MTERKTKTEREKKGLLTKRSRDEDLSLGSILLYAEKQANMIKIRTLLRSINQFLRKFTAQVQATESSDLTVNHRREMFHSQSYHIYQIPPLSLIFTEIFFKKITVINEMDNNQQKLIEYKREMSVQETGDRGFLEQTGEPELLHRLLKLHDSLASLLQARVSIESKMCLKD